MFTSTHDSKPQGSCCLLARSCFLPLLEINGRMVYYKNVTFGPKDMNPPNCPQLRPIEEFWALMKAHLRKHVSAFETIQQFEKDWKKMSKLVAKKSVRNLMRNVKGAPASLQWLSSKC